jgi:hypothetical protein
MDWSLSPYHFFAFMEIFLRHLRQPDPGGFTTRHGRPTPPDGNIPNKRYLQHTRWTGAKILPNVEDLPLHGDPGARAGPPPPRRPPSHQARPTPPPHQGFLGADRDGTPHGHRHRHGNRLLFCTCRKFSGACEANPNPPMTRYSNKQRASSKGALVDRGYNRHFTCFSLSRLHDSSSASCTPSLATSGAEAEYA